MKRCTTSYDIGEMQIKATVRYFGTPTKIAKIQNTDNTECWREYGATETFIPCWWKCKILQKLWNIV